MDDWKPLCADSQISQFSTYETKSYYLAKTTDDRFIKISPEIKILLSYMDGEHTIEAIVLLANQHYAANLTVDSLEKLIRTKLIPGNLVMSDDGSPLPTRSHPSIHFLVISSRVLWRIGQMLLPLFEQRVAILIVLYSCVVLLGYFFTYFLTGTEHMASLPIIRVSIYNSAWIFFAVMFSSVIHEMGHVAASVKNHIVPRSAGIGLYFFSPVFYVDVSETWVLSPNKRLLVDVGGIYLQTIFVGILATANLFFNNLILHQIILSILFLMLVNLFPFIKLDGYWIFSDIIGLPNLDLRAREYVLSIIQNREQYGYLSNTQQILLPIFAFGKFTFMVWFGIIGLRNLYYLLAKPILHDYLRDLVHALLTLNIEMFLFNLFPLLSIGFGLFYLVRIIIYSGKKAFSMKKTNIA